MDTNTHIVIKNANTEATKNRTIGRAMHTNSVLTYRLNSRQECHLIRCWQWNLENGI